MSFFCYWTRDENNDDEEIIPIEIFIDVEQVALVETLLSKKGANRVARLEHKEWVVAGNPVERSIGRP